MKEASKTTSRTIMERIGPLLAAIGREARERRAAIARLEARGGAARSSRTRLVDAELARHRRALRRLGLELRALGCRLESIEPLILRIHRRRGQGRALTSSEMWCIDA